MDALHCTDWLILLKCAQERVFFTPEHIIGSINSDLQHDKSTSFDGMPKKERWEFECNERDIFVYLLNCVCIYRCVVLCENLLKSKGFESVIVCQRLLNENETKSKTIFPKQTETHSNWSSQLSFKCQRRTPNIFDQIEKYHFFWSI